MIERIYGLGAGWTPQETALASTVFDVVTEPETGMLAAKIKTKADLDRWLPKFQAFFETIVLPDI